MVTPIDSIVTTHGLAASRLTQKGWAFALVDVTQMADVGDTGSGMGVASGDYDGDGRYDLFITNWERELNALYRNTTEAGGPITFQYSTFRIGVSGLGNGMTGWGAHLVDLDNDTDRDLLIINGRVPVTNLETDPELVRFIATAHGIWMAAQNGRDNFWNGRNRLASRLSVRCFWPRQCARRL